MVEPPLSSYLVWSVYPLTLSLVLFVVMLAIELPCSELTAKQLDFKGRFARCGIVLRADRHMPYREVAAVAALLRDSGFERLIFESSRAPLFGAGRPSTSR